MKRVDNKLERRRKDTDRRGFLRTLGVGTLGIGLGAEALTKLTGCGDTYNVNNYYGPDGGSAQDSIEPDTLAQDSLKADACASKDPAFKCSDKSAAVSGVLNKGEHMLLGNGFGIEVDDFDVNGPEPEVMISIIDNCHNVLNKETLKKGKTLTIWMGGGQIDILAEDIAVGSTQMWTKLSIKVPCTPTHWCKVKSGILNQGESLTVDNHKIKVDDMAWPTVSTPGFGLFSVLDSSGTVLKKLKIYEGTSEEVQFGNSKYQISVPKVAPGYTFGAKWVEIEVFKGSSASC